MLRYGVLVVDDKEALDHGLGKAVLTYEMLLCLALAFGFVANLAPEPLHVVVHRCLAHSNQSLPNTIRRILFKIGSCSTRPSLVALAGATCWPVCIAWLKACMLGALGDGHDCKDDRSKQMLLSILQLRHETLSGNVLLDNNQINIQH